VAVAYEQRPMDGSQERIEQLFRAHHERVLRAAYRITGNMADAEDIAQTVFIRLAVAGGHIDNPESYLYRAALNGAIDLIRRRQGERAVELTLASGVSSGAPEDSPERNLSSGELGTWLRKAIAALSPRSAEMFVLRYIEDRDSREIAEVMGTSRAVVAVTLHQARAKLKKQFRMFMRGER